MMRRAAMPLLMSGLLLSGCAGTAESGAVTTEQETPEAAAAQTSEPEPTLKPEDFEGLADDEPLVPTTQELKVGETATIPGVYGQGEVEVTLTGNVYLYYEEEEGYDAVFAFDAVNNGDVPADLAAPIDNGGWFWVTEDNVQSSFYDSPVDDHSPPWAGAVPDTSGKYPAGNRRVNLIEEVHVAEPGGSVSYIDENGYEIATWSIPDTMSGDGYDEVLEIMGL